MLPNAQEVISNPIDEDCDGVSAVRRSMVAAMFSASAPWTVTGTVSVALDGDTVTVGNGTAGGGYRRLFGNLIPWGKLHLILDVESNTTTGGPLCFFTVSTDDDNTGTDTDTSWTITGQGTGTLTSGALGVLDAPRHLTAVDIFCEAGASVTVDWFSLQNTADVLPPASEYTVTWDDVDLPGGGSPRRSCAVALTACSTPDQTLEA